MSAQESSHISVLPPAWRSGSHQGKWSMLRTHIWGLRMSPCRACLAWPESSASNPSPRTPGFVTHTENLNTRGGGRRIRNSSHPRLCNELEDSLGYMKLKKKKRRGKSLQNSDTRQDVSFSLFFVPEGVRVYGVFFKGLLLTILGL